MLRRLQIAVALACLAVASPGGAAPVPAVAVGPVICRLVQRHQVIVARAGRQGPTYAVESRGGAVLSPDMTMDQIAVRNPELHRQIRTLTTAVSWAGIEE